MALIPGSRLGPYEITAQIGAGGMGEVYRARDTKLRRDVALKILPDVFASDAERVARFSREAHALAALNHPHIAQIYGIEESDHTRALIMELVDGEDLAQRLASGPIPVDEALTIARQIAEALEAAHEQGIVHRDLKPANIKIRPDGSVKVLDFGLAKPLGPHIVSTPPGALTDSPTITSPIAASGAGILLGTAAYMAPEQAKGRAVDKRADIWAFGCVLFEMLTGRRAFAGDDATDTLAQILMKDPDWSLLPAGVPSPVRKLLRRCLEKDRQRRLDSAADARLEIDDALGGTPESPPVVTPSRSAAPRKWFGWSVTALLAVVAGIVVARLNFRAPPGSPEMRLDVAVPAGSDLREFALSPDGQRVVAAMFVRDQHQLWVRSLNSSTWQPLKGTEGARSPFWSPESRAIGFFAGSKLKRINIDGTGLQMLTDARQTGGAWSQNGVIVFAASIFGPLARISASGGEQPIVITKLEGQQIAHMYPFFLPDGNHFLFFSRGAPGEQGIYLASLDSAESKMLVPADEGPPVHVPPGWLLFVRQQILRAQRFDVQKLELSGDVLAVASSVANSFSASTTGLIGYRAASARRTQLVWAGRAGKPLGTFGPQSDTMLSAPSLSPDERRVAMWQAGDNSGDVVLIDATRITSFTFDPTPDRYPIWSPDGRTIVFDSTRQKSRDLYRSNNSGGEERLLATPQAKTANDWSFDGRFILFQSNDPKTGIDLWVLPLEGKREPYPFLRTAFNERRATFSPDGRWVAYLSNESGQYEVFVRPFFDPRQSLSLMSDAGTPASKWKISTNGGIQPCWSADGKELYYIGPDGKLMAVTINVTGSMLDAAAPVALFAPRVVGADSVDAGLQFDVSRDGRFLLNTISDDTSPITVIVNWSPETPN